MEQSKLYSKTINEDNFWKSLHILISKPHVVNKRLWGCIVISKHYVKCLPKNFDRAINESRQLKHDNINELTFMQQINDLDIQTVDKREANVELLLVELLPKTYTDCHAYQIICLQKTELQVQFIDVTPLELKQNLCPTFSYTFQLQNSEIILKISPDVPEMQKKWLNNTVLPQVIKWSREFADMQQNNICNESLALVAQDKYYEKYNILKLKYGLDLVQKWPECTDPKKFVYEDVAIATYLLLLWEEKPSQSFVDVGCGNGLLVYILTMEGHKGMGVDVRKRKIWDLYPDNVNLKVMTITPSNIHTISSYDWIIGNHSDEMTPWIPVIAARSSYETNFFLLPCCAYNFNGTKYQRQNSSKSQYNEYLDYIKKLCELFGFQIEMDRLKIPSTKRICMISKLRIYEKDEYEKYHNFIQEYVNQEVGLSKCNEIDVSVNNYKTRDSVEKVRNCTQLDKHITEDIVKCVTSYLLESREQASKWSNGKRIKIDNIVQLIPANTLKMLKSECGGLQTLLRNNHQIFDVQKGYVQLRYPRSIDEVKNKMNKKNGADLKLKVKKCWFYNNHPQGCPLHSSVCSYLHEKL